MNYWDQISVALGHEDQDGSMTPNGKRFVEWADNTRSWRNGFCWGLWTMAVIVFFAWLLEHLQIGWK